MDGVAPFFCTAKAEAAVAHFKAKAWFMPLARLVIKYPKKVSPAAVVSTASTLNDLPEIVLQSTTCKIEPREPKVNTNEVFGYFFS